MPYRPDTRSNDFLGSFLFPFFVFTIVSLLAAGVWAQDAPAGEDEEAEVIEEVVVTGSRIKRRDFTSISPIATFSAEDITFSGITNLEDLANDMPQLVASFGRTSNNPGNGSAQLDLRGLGPGRTLVMLNGHRAAPHDVFGAVDVNNIPAALVQRVEIVTGGASTVYGSDAVSGVVNFILNTDFTGVEVSAQYDIYGAGDGEVIDASVTFGSDFANGRGHIMGFVNYQERSAVLADAREFTAVTLLEADTPEGELVESGSGAVPGGRIRFPSTDLPGIGPTDDIIFDPDGSVRPFINPDDQFNFAPDNYLQTPFDRKMVGAFGNFQLLDDLNAFAEFTYAETQSDLQLAPSPFFEFIAFNVDHPSLTPEQQSLAVNNWDADGDGIAEVFLQRRLEEIGPRQRLVSSDSWRALAGLKGAFGFGWDWEAAFSYSKTSKDEEQRNGVSRNRLLQALLADPASGQCFDPSGGCVPVSLFGDGSITTEAAEFLRSVDIFNNSTVEEQIFSFNTTGEVIDLPAGTLAMAVGVEWRDLSSTFISDPALIGGQVLGFISQSGVDGSLDVKEAYAEVLAPILAGKTFAHYLGLEAGVRYSDYSLSGGAWNWKFGIDWAPVAGLRFRAMTQRAVRAPNINELFRVPIESIRPRLTQGLDGCSASLDPVGNGLTDLCIAQGIAADQLGVFEALSPFPTTLFDQGGNTQLEPEEADTFTVGVVIQPSGIEGLSLAIDYYNIEINNSIGGIDPGLALLECFSSKDANSALCESIVRGPSGNIIEFTNPQFNLALSKASGIDLILDYGHDLPASLAIGGEDASWALRIFANHTIEKSDQASPSSDFIDCVGFFGFICDGSKIIPENRVNTRLTYFSGPLSASLSWDWIGKLHNHIFFFNELTGSDFGTGVPTASPQNYIDLSFHYVLNDSWEFHGGVSNLFENTPPLLGFGATQSNTAPQLFDIFGRRYFFGFKFRL